MLKFVEYWLDIILFQTNREKSRENREYSQKSGRVEMSTENREFPLKNRDLAALAILLCVCRTLSGVRCPLYVATITHEPSFVSNWKFHRMIKNMIQVQIWAKSVQPFQRWIAKNRRLTYWKIIKMRNKKNYWNAKQNQMRS